MVNRVAFRVPGEPRVQPRGKPIPFVKDGKARVRMVSAYHQHPVWEWRARIIQEAAQACQGRAFIDPVRLSVLFVLPFTGTAKKRSPNPRTWHTARKDIDNFLKPLKDALVEARIIEDDGQIVAYGKMAKIRAEHGEQPHTLVLLEPAGDVALAFP